MQNTCEQFTISPNLVGTSRQIPQVASTDILARDVSAAAGEETISDVSVPKAGVEEVLRDGFSCMNQQCVPLLHLAN